MKKSKVLKILFFTMAWIAAYNTAFISGDDVVHLSNQIYKEIFFPRIGHHWIPNRVLDEYTRGILTLIFDQLYFFSNSVIKVNLFIFYKIFSATIYVIYLHYLILAINVATNDYINNSAKNILIDILLYITILILIPWVNQVHFLTYQVPALIGFYILILYNQRLTDYLNNNNHKKDNIYLYLYIYIFAYSMEGFVLSHLLYFIICIIIIIGLMFFKRNYNRQLIYLNIYLIIIFFLVILQVKFFSVRASHNAFEALNAINLVYLPGLLESSIFKIIKLKYLDSIIIISTIITGSICLINYYKGIFIINFNIFVNMKYKLSLDFLFLILSLTSIQIISTLTNTNYFSHNGYPWGDLLLILKLILLTNLIIILIKLESKNYFSIGMVILFIVMSKMFFNYLESIQYKTNISNKIAIIYNYVELNKKINNDLINFSIDQIDQSIRPFPSKSSPDWFNSDFKILFEKYHSYTQKIPQLE